MNEPYKISVSDLLRLACEYAIQDRLALLEAYEKLPDEPVVAETKAYISALRIYMRRRWPKKEAEK